MSNEHISLILKKARMARQRVTITTDDERQYTGTVEGINEWTIIIRLDDGIVHIPIAEDMLVVVE